MSGLKRPKKAARNVRFFQKSDYIKNQDV